MATMTQLSEFESIADASEAGYNACYNNDHRSDNPYLPGSSDNLKWDLGYGEALGERESDNWNDMDQDDADHYNSQEDFDSGRWTQADEDSMNAGPDLPTRNDAGEYMDGGGRGW